MRKLIYIVFSALLVVSCVKDLEVVATDGKEYYCDLSCDGIATKSSDGTLEPVASDREMQLSLVSATYNVEEPTSSCVYTYDGVDLNRKEGTRGLFANNTYYNLIVASPASEMVKISGTTSYGHEIVRGSMDPIYVSEPIRLHIGGIVSGVPDENGSYQFYYRYDLGNLVLKQRRSKVEVKFKSDSEDDSRRVNTLRFVDVYDKAYTCHINGLLFADNETNNHEVNDFRDFPAAAGVEYPLVDDYTTAVVDKNSDDTNCTYFISSDYSQDGAGYPTLVVGLNDAGETKEVNVPLNINMKPMYKYTYEINISSVSLYVRVKEISNWFAGGADGTIAEVSKFAVNIKSGDISWFDVSPDGELNDVDKSELPIDKEVSFMDIENSNCYLINPETSGNSAYYIPIDRIDEFWGSKDYVTDIYYQNKYTLSNIGDNWEAVMLWHDFHGADNELIAKVTFAQSEYGGKPCVRVVLPEGFAGVENNCNITYVVRKKNDKMILWSWHLWITDYNPYGIASSVQIADVDQPMAYTFGGCDGELHRYKDYNTPTPYWSTGGIYEDKFMMDRNIGARSADFEGYGSIKDFNVLGPGALYYQWGRKDPFPYYGIYMNGYKYEASDFKKDGLVPIYTAVMHPYRFYLSSTTYDLVSNPNPNNWCSNKELAGYKYIWNDIKIESANYNSEKSLFDPSPQGFSLPLNQAYNDLRGALYSDEVENSEKYPCKLINSDNNLPVVPYDRCYNGFAYFPTTGFFYNTVKKYGAFGTSGYCWCATPRTNSTVSNVGAVFRMNNTIAHLHTLSRAYGLSVRSIGGEIANKGE